MPCHLAAPSHYLNYVDLSSKVFCGIHLRAISQEALMNLICNICSEITILKLVHLPGANELNDIRDIICDISRLFWFYCIY